MTAPTQPAAAASTTTGTTNASLNDEVAKALSSADSTAGQSVQSLSLKNSRGRVKGLMGAT